MNKIHTTNLLAFLFAFLGSFSPIYNDELFLVGIFALSGSATNWIAVHMLFEKVPFLYGSGVIQNKFEEFKKGIKKLIICEFFNLENIENFLKKNRLNLDNMINKKEEDRIFFNLIQAIKESQLGTMLALIGGEKALLNLKEPIIKKIKETLSDLQANQLENNNLITNFQKDIEYLIDKRMDNMRPEDVKMIVELMIKEHLGWLVIWGAFFGATIGLIYSQLKI